MSSSARYRWVEVYAPVGSTGIALATPPPDQQVTPQVAGITLATDDIETTHAALADRGVDVDAEIMRMGGGARRCSGSATPTVTR